MLSLIKVVFGLALFLLPTLHRGEASDAERAQKEKRAALIALLHKRQVLVMFVSVYPKLSLQLYL